MRGDFNCFSSEYTECVQSKYVGSLRWLKKSSGRSCQVHINLRWLKIRPVQFLFDFSSLYYITCQNFEMVHFFELENSEIAQNSNHFCLESNFYSNCEPSQSYMHVTTLPPMTF